ncbi:MAG: ABC transporter ATP-binding protein [Lachnospiraceae bacterium]|nr:ABC transporter ATP-binding protein [Lachnospiraceae bacterium]MCR4865785.1 ABC transporter ATP-binding protein [Lachnospiraceae bacterium]
MIQITNISKSFDDIKAVDDITVDIGEQIVFGLLGTNGAGKSTLLRMVSGILKPDSGNITVDDMGVLDNEEAKKNMFFISDSPYFFANSNPMDMMSYLSIQYPLFDKDKFRDYLKTFNLPEKRKIGTYSKGMKRQLALLLGICSNAKYLLCDESFDGLDPVMRQGIKSIFAKEMDERGLTPVIASHNLRELEDICDHVGLLHKGGVLLSKDLEDMKLNIQRVQCVYSSEEDESKLLQMVEPVKAERMGSLCTYTLRGTREDVENAFACVNTVFFETLPLSLEEIFISETEVVGYDIKKLILG